MDSGAPVPCVGSVFCLPIMMLTFAGGALFGDGSKRHYIWTLQ